MRAPPTPRVEDIGLQTWMAGIASAFQGRLTPHNLHESGRRQVNTIYLGALAGAETFRIYVGRQPMTLEAVVLTSNTATTGSTNTAKWVFTVAVNATTVNPGGKSTSSGEIKADTQYDLGVTANTRLVNGDVVKLTVTKTGVPTSLATARLEAHAVVLLGE